jgi:hypothetical protein
MLPLVPSPNFFFFKSIPERPWDAKRGFGKHYVVCGQGIFVTKDYWVYLVPQIGSSLCLKVGSPSKKVSNKEVLPTSVNKTLVEHVQPNLAECLLAMCTFDLWMSKGAHDVCKSMDQVTALWINKLMDCRLVKSFYWEPINIKADFFS